MGETVTYRCDTCKYSAQVSGGPDVGMLVRTNTYMCSICKEIADVVTGYCGDDVTPDDCGIGKCPICDSSEHLKEWDNKTYPCPKCDGVMIVPPDADMILWD